jgi:type IV pilus biogenesis protein CpaD/CtpE
MRYFKMPRLPTSIPLVASVVLLVAGCAATDPYEKEGVWHPAGTNEANLRAMVAIPSDLVSGVGDGHGNSQQAEVAVERLRADKVKDLPASGVAQFSTTGSSGGSSSGGSSASTGGQ